MDKKTFDQLESTQTFFISNTQATASPDALTLKLDDITSEALDNALYAREFAHNRSDML